MLQLTEDKKTNDKIFCIARWHMDDIICILKDLNISYDNKILEKLFDYLKGHFSEVLVERGNEILKDMIVDWKYDN